MPKVSVIVPSYNHARFLERRLRSILEQDFADFELIYLDDASTDGSEAVADSFLGDPRARRHRNAINSGSTFRQWNRGVRDAQGEYVWIAESDDEADPRLLGRLVRVLDGNPRVGLAYSESWIVDEDDRILGKGSDLAIGLDRRRWSQDYVRSGRTECGEFLVLRNTIPNASAVVFRRALFEDVGGADETMRVCGDWLAWARILLRSDVAFLAEPLNRFRSHPGAVRLRTKEDTAIRESWRVSQAILREVRPPAPVLAQLQQRCANEWASVVVRGGKSALESALRSFEELASGDRRFAWRCAGEILRYAFDAGRRRVARAWARRGKALRPCAGATTGRGAGASG